jgi:putative transposase
MAQRRERPPDHSAIRAAMKEVAGKRRRFGYRRIGIMLERKGMIMNHKKLYRLYREEGLSVGRRRGRKRARGSRTPMPVPLAPGARWSMDFVSDTFGASRKFRILAINDDCFRENLCLIADTSISGARVARELDTLVRLYGKPACIVSDNGTEFTSRAILEWAGKNGIEWHYIDPASLSRTGSSRASTARCAMNSSTRNCSTAWPMPAGSWPSGATITTTSGHTHLWEIERLHKRVERSSRTKPSRTTRLCRRRGHRI